MTIKWGAEIPCKGRPEWLQDDDICAVLSNGNWCDDSEVVRSAKEWFWNCNISAFKLLANHPYYRTITKVANLGSTIDIIAAIATLEAAGYIVTAPDPYEALMDALSYEKDMIWTGDALALLRRAIPDPASIDMTALAKGE
jgi:hypothetical protein